MSITKNKVLATVLVGLMAFNGYNYVSQVVSQGSLNASILGVDNEYADLTSSYFKIEGTAGQFVKDFKVDYKGKIVSGYTITSPTDSLKVTQDGLKLVKEGTGIATISYQGAKMEIPYNVSPDPNAPKEEELPVPEQEDTTVNSQPEITYKLCNITANGQPASGVIMYIDDSKNAFKTKGQFYIEESFLDGNTHSIYIAKFTNKGPVAYKVCDFTSLAGEVNFMNYNESDVEVKGLNINIKTNLNELF